jgi:hypothetical protein
MRITAWYSAWQNETIVAGSQLCAIRQVQLSCITTIPFMQYRFLFDMPVFCFFIFQKNISPCQLTMKRELNYCNLDYPSNPPFSSIHLLFISLSPRIPNQSVAVSILLSPSYHHSPLTTIRCKENTIYRGKLLVNTVDTRSSLLLCTNSS